MTHESERIYDDSDIFPIGIFSQTTHNPNPHHHIEYEIFYLSKGEVVFGLDNYEISLKSRNVVFINPQTTHYIKTITESKDFQYYSITFDISALGKENDPIRKTFESIRISQILNLPYTILEQIDHTANAEKRKIFGHETMIKSLLLQIISYIIQTKQFVEISNSVKADTSHRINAIDVSLKYVQEHYRETITMYDLLEITHYSKSHFIRLFKKHTGMNLTDYVNKYRIEKSCLDLLYSHKNITEIATENGFNTVQYFSKTFKQYMNCTPKKYQKEGKNIISPPSMASIL